MNISNPWIYWYILVHTHTYAYILVHTRTYSYIPSYNTVYFESGWIRLAMTYCHCCTLMSCIADSILPLCGLFDGQASQVGLAAPNCHCQVYLSIYLNIQKKSLYILAWYIAKCLANLWIEGMKAPLRHIKWITSGKHGTPEQLRLPFHSESTHCKNQRTYSTSTKYILVYTCMYYAYLCIYSYIL